MTHIWPLQTWSPLALGPVSEMFSYYLSPFYFFSFVLAAEHTEPVQDGLWEFTTLNTTPAYFSSPYSFSKHGSLAKFESYFQLNPLNPLAISDLSPSSRPRHQSGLLSFQMTERKMIPDKSCYRLPPHPANVAMDRKVQDYIWLHAWQNLGQDVFSLLLNWPFLMSSNSQSSYPTSLLIPLVKRCLPLGLWQKTTKEGPDSPRFNHMLFLRQELWSGDVRCSALIGRGSVTWMLL